MYAVIKTGGKQYRVAPDETLIVEKLPGEPGDRIEFGDVLMYGDGGDPQLGAPFIEGAMVSAEVVEQGRAEKIIIFKKKRRQNYRRRNGHRQYVTTVRILDILLDGKRSQAATAKPTRESGTNSEAPAPEKKTRVKKPAEPVVETQADVAADVAEAKPRAQKKPKKTEE